MKLKLKASLQDWLIFILFALVLLYIVAIGVLNINTLSTQGVFYGLNPLKAFTGEFLWPTIMFYLLSLIGLFVSVSSYFFEREKGFGIVKSSKEQKGGYSDWAKEKDMKKDLSEVIVKASDYDYAGFPLINDGEKMWVDNGDTHNLVLGSTGTGKTQCVIHPLVKILAKKGESMIITDPKAEIYQENASLLKEKGYKIVILNFREPQRGNTWNPLDLPYNLYRNGNSDKAMELLDDLALNILYEEGSKDPFWEKTSADYFAGLALGLFDDANPEEININSISLMSTAGEEKFGPRSNYIKEYFNSKNPSSASYISASGTVFAPEETKGSILSTFRQKIRIFASRENLSEMLSTSDFDMASIGKEKTAVFMIIQDEKTTYHALATIFIKQCYETLIDVAQSSPNGELPVRTNFVLDEFANMPPLKDITTMITAARSRKIRFTMIIQSFAQLDAVYGKDNAQIIRGNCYNLLYLLTTELSALKEMSELCGEKKIKVGKGDKEKEETRPLITVAELQKMKQFEAIVKRVRMDPFKTRLKPNFEINWNTKKEEADPFVQREKKEVKVFDIKEFVNNKNKDKLMNNINSNKGFVPDFNPFLNMRGQTPQKNNNPIDLDELVKKIDQKIAEIEKEEQLEKQSKQQVMPQGIINKEKVTKNITDDEFFDDFFDD